MKGRLATAAFLSLALASCRTQPSLGVSVQKDAHVPQPWRPLTEAEKVAFDLGYAVFNTQWAPANTPAGRTDGLGPLFNVQSCDACHNSRRRGRGPRGDGDAPGDLVIQLGRLLPDGRVERGTPEYGRVLNTSAVQGFTPEASVSIRYEEQNSTLRDGSLVSLRTPHYRIANLSGPPLALNTVIMPRMPPPIYGTGLLERVPDSALIALAEAARNLHASGHLARLPSPRIPEASLDNGAATDAADDSSSAIGHFGWQATEATVASRTASALAREMGLSTTRITAIDCGTPDEHCLNAPTGGAPEVEPGLFRALLVFEDLHAVPVKHETRGASSGQRLFDQAGCSRCHVSALPVETARGVRAVIHPYTDLLLHNLGEGLADRSLVGEPAQSEWRTAPLWGMGAAAASGQPLRLLHDGRARSIDEAVLWHAGDASAAREHFTQLSGGERRTLAAWIAQL